MSDFSEEQKNKLIAETAKIKFEGEQIEQNMKIALERHQAEMAKLEVEKKLAETNERKINEDYRLAQLMTEGTLINVEREREKRQIELASDHYYMTYYFDHEVSQESVRRCMTKLQTWCRTLSDEKKCEIELIINSPGGDVVNGLALYDFIDSLKKKGHRVVTGSLGMAASMGSILLQAGDLRYMGSGAMMLIHEVSSVAWGKTSEVEDRLSLIKKFQERAIQIYVDRSGGKLTKRDVEEGWKRKDWWLTAEQCLELGLIDEIR